MRCLYSNHVWNLRRTLLVIGTHTETQKEVGYFNAINPWPNNILIIKSITVRSVRMRLGHTLQAEEKKLHILYRHDSYLIVEYHSSSLPNVMKNPLAATCRIPAKSRLFIPRGAGLGAGLLPTFASFSVNLILLHGSVPLGLLTFEHDDERTSQRTISYLMFETSPRSFLVPTWRTVAETASVTAGTAGLPWWLGLETQYLL